MFKNKKVLILAAHPDDETIGCGGTISYLLKNNCEVNVIFFTDGISSRTKSVNEKKKRSKNLQKVVKLMKFKIQKKFNFKDNALDSTPLLYIVKKLETAIKKFKPEIIFTHFFDDLNIDHKLVYQATMTACRPSTNSSVKKIFSYEVPSATDWSLDTSFKPNFFICIDRFFKKKITALKLYGTEMKKYPHPRNIESILINNKLRGHHICRESAEAFRVERFIYD